MQVKAAGGAVTGTVLVAAMLAAAGCRSLPKPVACAPDETVMTRDTLYFGRHRPDGGSVGDAEWRAFVDDVVTPRFPDGFTLLSGTGQWRGDDGRIEREPAEVLSILHAGDTVAHHAIDGIVAEYVRRFAQESVLRERGRTCAKF